MTWAHNGGGVMRSHMTSKSSFTGCEIVGAVWTGPKAPIHFIESVNQASDMQLLNLDKAFLTSKEYVMCI